MDDLEKISNFYKKKILIIGCTGFVGGWACLFLKKLKANIYGIGLDPNTNPSFFTACKLKKKIKYSKVNISNKKKLFEYLNKIKPEIVFNFAAQSLVLEGYKNPYITFQTNFTGVLNILDCSKKIKSIKKMIFYTTDKVYDNKDNKKIFYENDHLFGEDPYSASKSSSEQLIKCYSQKVFKDNKNVIVIRAGNIIGGGDWSKFRIIPDLIRSIKNKKKIKIRNKKSVRPWQNVIEVIFQTLYVTYKSKKKYDTFNIAPSINCHKSVEFLISQFSKKIDQKLYMDNKREKSFYKKEKKFLYLSSKKIKKIIKTKSLNFNEALSYTLNWYINYYRGSNSLEISNNQINEYLIKAYENNKDKIQKFKNY